MIQERPFVIGNDALKHLKDADNRMGQLIDKAGDIQRTILPDPLTALVESIVYQQLAFAAANTIWQRVLSRLGEIAPQNILEAEFDVLRACGLSSSKIQYIRNIAEAFQSGYLTADAFESLSNEEIIKKLVHIKGIGQWTAEMFLMFCLGREDVFSYKDLGLRNGIQWLYGLNEAPSQRYCDELIKTWSPYATIASLYLWEITIQKFFKSPVEAILGIAKYSS